METTRTVLQAHGLLVNEAKTEGPSQEMVFLGLGLNSRDQTLFVPPAKVNDLRSLIGKMGNLTSASRRELQTLIGKFSHVATALHGARPFFRQLIDATRGLPSPNARTPMTNAMHADLRMWQLILTSWNGKSTWLRKEEVVITHDASKSGFGFFLEHLPPWFDRAALPEALLKPHGFAGTFTAQQLNGPAGRSIQYGELFAIAASVALYGPYLAGCKCSLLLRSDNEADVHIVNRQSTKAPTCCPYCAPSTPRAHATTLAFARLTWQGWRTTWRTFFLARHYTNFANTHHPPWSVYPTPYSYTTHPVLR